MSQPPRRPNEAMLGAGLWRRVTVTGIGIAGVSLAAAQWALTNGRPWQSVLFTTLGFAQLGVALAVRSRPAPGAPRNWLLPAAVALSVLLQLAAVLAPPLRLLLGTEALSVADFVACAALGAVPGLVLGATRWVTGRKSSAARSSAAAASRVAARG